MSLGFPRTYPGVDALDVSVRNLANSGVKVAVAAGNESQNTTNVVPARMTDSNVYVVASSAEGDIWSSFSNFGSSVDYIAPGSDIPSTYMNGGYQYSSGTSMACPHVAALLLWGNIRIDGYINGYPVATR